MQATNRFAECYLRVFSYPVQRHSSTGHVPATAALRQQLLPCACLKTSTLQQLKLQNFAIPGVCATSGRQAARGQLCRSKGSVTSTRGPEVSDRRQKPFVPVHTQCNGVTLLAQLHQARNEGKREKKLPQRES